MQTLVIGDIHGCYLELQALLDKAGLSEGDSIISLGFNETLLAHPGKLDTESTRKFVKKPSAAKKIVGLK